MATASNQLSLRRQTLGAMLYLTKARFVVRFLAFSRWRGSLGTLLEMPRDQACSSPPPDLDATSISQARAIARRVERAANRLPGESKCLPKAMALQWMMQRAGLPSRLVIAIHRYERASNDTYHAWVEVSQEMLIGHCDRSDYAGVAGFDQFG